MMQQEIVSLDQIKESVIRQIVDERVQSGKITTQIQYDIEYQELKNKIMQDKLVTEIRMQSGLSDSKAFTDTAYEMYMDLCTVFSTVNEVDQTINKHKKINESVINTLKIQVAKANDSLDNLEGMLQEKYNSNNFTESFRDMSGFEEDQSFYTDRFGEQLSLSYRAYFDKFNEGITLPYISKNNTLIHSNGTSFADIRINKQLGSGIGKLVNERTGIKKAIDTSTDTYWSETISCDSPMRVELPGVSDVTPGEIHYYGIKNGAVCEIEIRMENMTVINEVSLIPYGEYPFEIVAIRYYETDDITESVKEIVFKNNPDNLLSNKVLRGPTSFKFQDVYCKKLRVLINQIHYTKEIFICSTNDTAKNEIWLNATSGIQPSLVGKEMFVPLYNDKASVDPAWVMMSKNAKSVKDINVESLLYGGADKRKHISKYNYTYGFYNIGVYNNDFQDVGVFISKPINAHGSIKAITLESSEQHPEVLGGTHTDIEYYISYGNGWLPILPLNVSIVKSELLLQAPNVGVGHCKLRFKAKNILSVNVNSMPLTYMDDYIVINDASGNIETIVIIAMASNAKYTVNYEPVQESHIVELIDSGITPKVSNIDKFTGNNTVYTELSEIPYISPSTGTIMKVITDDGRILTEEDGHVKCVTNIYAASESYKRFSDENLQYYVDKNIVYFNKPIPDSYVIELSYVHYISSIRLKAILRRNIHSNNWLSPALDGFKLKFNTID